MCDDAGNCGPHIANDMKVRPHTEIRKIMNCRTNGPDDPFCRPDDPLTDQPRVTLQLNKPLDFRHKRDEAVGVEFVQYSWYSDVDTGTVFFHDHVDFNSWDLGLVGAHVIEPAGSTWHDPITGNLVRSGTIVDVHAPADTSIGYGQKGPFREFVLFHHKTHSKQGRLGSREATINLKAEPILVPESGDFGRNGEPAHWFSSVTHGDPFTPMPRAYVGDPFVIRHVGVVDRVGGIRLTGHRFRIERWAGEGALSDTSPLGISERFDLVLNGGAGGPQGKAGDYLYYNTLGRDMLGGAWGVFRVYNTLPIADECQCLPDGKPLLQPLPGLIPTFKPPHGELGFPQQVQAPHGDNSGEEPDEATLDSGNCDSKAEELPPVKVYIGKSNILRGDLKSKVDAFSNGVVYSLTPFPDNDVDNHVSQPLVLRVNQGECLVVELTNHLDGSSTSDPREPKGRAGLHVGELRFDPQSSYGAAIGLNLDSSVAPGQTRTYRFYADEELGATIAFNLANPLLAAKGAFGAIIVEPKGSTYVPIRGDVVGEIWDKGGNLKFHEIVALFHDSDGVLGHNSMKYPTEAHCRDNTNDDPSDPKPAFPFNCVGSRDLGFTSISYKREQWRLRQFKDLPSYVYATQKPVGPSYVYIVDPEDPLKSDIKEFDLKEFDTKHPDPALQISGKVGESLRFRVLAPWGEQAHVFSLTGHRC